MENQISPPCEVSEGKPIDKPHIVAAYQQSGLSLRAFATQNNIARSTLHRWTTERPAPAHSSSAHLVEVPNLLGALEGGHAYQLHFPCGVMLRVPSGFDGQELRLLLQLVQEL